MVIEFILLFLIGILFIFIGLRIWKREQISLIHEYHYTKVTNKDKKPYTEQMGKACIIMGSGTILTGIIVLITKTLFGWTFFALFFLWGLIKMILAQMKYNGGLF